MEWMIHSIKTLFRQKLRSCLTILGIAIGVFSVTIISVIGEVGKGAINQQLSNMGIDGVVLTTETSSHKRFGDSALQILAEDEAVTDSMPFDMQYAEAYVHGLVSMFWVFGVDPDADGVISV